MIKPFNQPNLERLVSVEEHVDETIESRGPSFLNLPPKIHLYSSRSSSNLLSLSRTSTPNLHKDMEIFDLENQLTPYGSRNNTPVASSRRNSRSHMLDPIPNAPFPHDMTDQNRISPPLYAAGIPVTLSLPGTPQLEPLREHNASWRNSTRGDAMDRLNKRSILDPIASVDSTLDDLEENPIQPKITPKTVPDPLTLNIIHDGKSPYTEGHKEVSISTEEENQFEGADKSLNDPFAAIAKADILLQLSYSPASTSPTYMFPSKSTPSPSGTPSFQEKQKASSRGHRTGLVTPALLAETANQRARVHRSSPGSKESISLLVDSEQPGHSASYNAEGENNMDQIVSPSNQPDDTMPSTVEATENRADPGAETRKKQQPLEHNKLIALPNEPSDDTIQSKEISVTAKNFITDSKTNTRVIQPKVFVSLEELDASTSLFAIAQENKQKRNDKSDSGTFLYDESKPMLDKTESFVGTSTVTTEMSKQKDSVGIFQSSSNQVYSNTSTKLNNGSQLENVTKVKLIVPDQDSALSITLTPVEPFMTDRDKKPPSTSQSSTKKMMSARAVEATNRLYEPPRKSAQRKVSSSAPKTQIPPRSARAKARSLLANDGERSVSNDKIPRGKGTKGPSPLTRGAKAKIKRDKLPHSHKVKVKPEAALVMKDLEENKQVLQDLKKEYDLKTERTLKRFDERLKTPGLEVDCGRGQIGETAIIPEILSTPVIVDAYPKPDEDEYKLLQKVAVTAVRSTVPRRVKSAVSRNYKSVSNEKKSKPPKSPTEPCEIVSTSSDKIVRATSAGLIVEKRAQHSKKNRSKQKKLEEKKGIVHDTGEIPCNFDPSTQAIVSGANWYNIMVKNESADQTVIESTKQTEVEDDIISPLPSAIQIQNHETTQVPKLDLSQTELHTKASEREKVPLSPILEGGTGTTNSLSSSMNLAQLNNNYITNENTDFKSGVKSDAELIVESTGFCTPKRLNSTSPEMRNKEECLPADGNQHTADEEPDLKLKHLDINNNNDSVNTAIQEEEPKDISISPRVEEAEFPEINPQQSDTMDNLAVEGKNIQFPLTRDVLAGVDYNVFAITEEVSVPAASERETDIAVMTSQRHGSEHVGMKESEDETSEEESNGVVRNFRKKMDRELEKYRKALTRSRSNLDALTLHKYNKDAVAISGKDAHVDLEEGLLPNLFGEAWNWLSQDNQTGSYFSETTTETYTNDSSLDELSTSSALKTIDSCHANGNGGMEITDKNVRNVERAISLLSSSSNSTLKAFNADHNELEHQVYGSFEIEENENLFHTVDGEEQVQTDSEDEMISAMEKTLYENIDSENTVEDNSEAEDFFSETDDHGPPNDPNSNSHLKLTRESLQQHDKQQQEELKKLGPDYSSIYDLNHYKVSERNNMVSRTSAVTKTTEWSQNTESTLQTELDTAACMGWKKGKELGHGSYGTVYEGLTRYGQLIAVKQVTLSMRNRAEAEKEYKQLQVEVELLKTVSHENVVSLLGTCLERNVVYIFMEHITGGSIASLLARYGALPEKIFRNYSRQILIGVEYLHSNSVVHRDIKGSNVMLMPSGVVKLIDFGCAKRLKENSLKGVSQDSDDASTLLKSVRGTPYWMAPEVITSEGHGPKSDIWSIGCTVIEMATTKPPLHELNQHAAMYHIGNGDKMPDLSREHFSNSACHFVKKCLTRNQMNRPSASELLIHSFITKQKKKKIHKTNKGTPECAQ